jgi:fucose permease
MYCGLESTTGLWGASYLCKVRGLSPALSATWISLFYAGITIGRFLTGFVTSRLTNNDLIRGGSFCVLFGVILLVLPVPLPVCLAGLLLIGLGCAPIFPCMIHETPARFGSANAQAIIGLQMATAYPGTSVLPPLFGLIAGARYLYLFPLFLSAYIFVLIVGSECLRRITGKKELA